MIEEIRNLVENAKSAFENAILRGKQQRVDAADIKEKAGKATNNTVGEASSLQQDDIIVFPSSMEDLDKSLIGMYFSERQVRDDNPTIGLLVPVIRKGRITVLRVYPGAFNRANRKWDEAAKTYSDEFIYPSGVPATDFRENNGSMYDVWASFIGKFVKVKARPKVKCYVLKNGATPDSDGRFPLDDDHYEPRDQRIGDYAYTTKEEAEKLLGHKLADAGVPDEGGKSGKGGK